MDGVLHWHVYDELKYVVIHANSLVSISDRVSTDDCNNHCLVLLFENGEDCTNELYSMCGVYVLRGLHCGIYLCYVPSFDCSPSCDNDYGGYGCTDSVCMNNQRGLHNTRWADLGLIVQPPIFRNFLYVLL
jgi:hypothetical protein